MSKIVKIFYITVSVIAIVLCAGECITLVKVPEASAHFGTYLLFLPLTSLGGGTLLTLIMWAATQKEDAKARMALVKIGELERMQHNLEDAANRREEFIASFAHELKTPLTAIIGYADMLRSKDMAPKPRFTAAGYIFSEGKRLEALSLKLMDIIVAGKQTFEKRRYEAGYFIREVAAVTVPSLSAEGLTLEMRWDIGEIEIEPDLFKTLLINLVDNSRKASRRGQSIELFGKSENGGYAFYVKDYGRGMKAEDMKKITEPFYMIDKSRSRAQNGAGLGLALCQRIAQLHGTELEYESTPDEGTLVRVFLGGGNKS